MIGSNIAMIVLFAHVLKAISIYSVASTQKMVTWFVGATIFLIGLGTAFTGYVLVCGNMSYWAALVILNLVTVIPAISGPITSALLGGASLGNLGLRRFTALHFLVALLSFILVIIHILLVHRSEPASSGHLSRDGVGIIAQVLAKDSIVLTPVLLLLTTSCIYALIHPDNWATFAPLSTPEHIEPEVYFLWTFAVIKLHNSKLAGVLLIIVIV